MPLGKQEIFFSIANGPRETENGQGKGRYVKDNKCNLPYCRSGTKFPNPELRDATTQPHKPDKHSDANHRSQTNT